MDIFPEHQEIKIDYKEDSSMKVELHDGSKMILHKLSKRYDPSSRRKAISRIFDSRDKGEIVTGLIYLDQNEKDTHDSLQTSIKPFNSLTQKELSPGTRAINEINRNFS